jgi:hypothetical protein
MLNILLTEVAVNIKLKYSTNFKKRDFSKKKRRIEFLLLLFFFIF